MKIAFKMGYIFILLFLCNSFSKTVPGSTGIVIKEGDKYNIITSFSYPSGNLISNGSFENNYTGFHYEKWIIQYGFDVPNPHYIQPVKMTNLTLPHSGREMAAVSIKYANASLAYLNSALFKVKPDQEYTIFLWYIAQKQGDVSWDVNSNKCFKGVVREFPGKGEPETKISEGRVFSTPYSVTSNWTPILHHFKTSPIAQYANICLLWSEYNPQSKGASLKGDFYFDDVYIVEGKICPERDVNRETLDCKLSKKYPTNIDVTRKYLNSKSKVVQTVTAEGDRDIVSKILYDKLGRIKRKTLPVGKDFKEGKRHKYIENLNPDAPLSELNKFYNGDKDETGYKIPNAKQVAYSEVEYENSPLGREIEVAGSGLDWSLANGTHTIKTHYSSSKTLDNSQITDVKNNETGHTGADGIPDVLDCKKTDYSDCGNYFIKQYKNIEGQITREFTDKFGNLVRKSSKLGSDWVNTDYIYDANGNLDTITSPEDGGFYNEQGNEVTSKLVTNMEYNTLNQMTAEETPATGRTEFLYDKLGRVVYSQTKKQSTLNEFSFIQYDEYGRVKYTGTIRDHKFDKAVINKPGWPVAYSYVKGGTFYEKHPSKEVGYKNDKRYLHIRTINYYDSPTPDNLSCPDTEESPSSSKYLSILPITGKNVIGSFRLNSMYKELKNELESGKYNLANIYELPLYVVKESEGPIIITPNVSEGNINKIVVGGKEIKLTMTQLVRTSDDQMAGNSEVTHREWYETLIANKKNYKPVIEFSGYLKGRLVKTLTCNFELKDSDVGLRDVSKTFNYDKYGNVTEVYQYNGYVEKDSKKWQLVKNQYDVQNRLVKKTVCGDAVECNPAYSHIENYSYDQLGRISKITDGKGDEILTNSYNSIGQLSKQNLKGDKSIIISYKYHLHGWIKEIHAVKSETGNPTLFSEVLYYEDNNAPGYKRYDGNITRVKYSFKNIDENISFSYKYDDLNRLVSSLANYFYAHEKTTYYDYYDDGRIDNLYRNGSKIEKFKHDYYYNLKGQLTKREYNKFPPGKIIPSVQNMEYDANGNLWKDDDVRKFRENMIIEYRSDNLPHKFTYDGVDENEKTKYIVYMVYDEGGNRVSKIEIKNEPNKTPYISLKHYFSSGKEIRESDEKSTVEFINLAGVGRISYNSENWEREYYLKNHLGSTMEVYDAQTGNVTYTASYLPYGKKYYEENETGGNDPTEEFTGHEFDEGIGLNYAGARYYDPEVGLWISPDAGRVNHNLYAYANNNPINFFDPDGNEPNKADAGNVTDVRNFTNVQAAEDYYRRNSDNRYIYTKKAGWIDLKHFFVAAEQSSYGWKVVRSINAFFTRVAGYIKELTQVGEPSFFSYEDLSSNYQGTEFGKTYNRDELFKPQFEDFMKSQGATAPQDAPNYDQLPNDETNSPDRDYTSQ